MTDNATDDYERLWGDLVSKRGGLDRLTQLDQAIISICAKMLVEVRSSNPADVPKIASTIAQLTATLPAPFTDDAADFKLSRLSDDELITLAELQAKGCDGAVPEWTVEPSTEAEVSEPERIGRDLGRWISERKESWRFSDASEDEKLYLRNEIASLCFPLIARNFWSSIWIGERDLAVSQAVAAKVNELAASAAAELKAPTTVLPELRPARLNVYDLPLPKIKPHGDYE